MKRLGYNQFQKILTWILAAAGALLLAGSPVCGDTEVLTAGALSAGMNHGGIIEITGCDDLTMPTSAVRRKVKAASALLPSSYRTPALTEVLSQGKTNLCWSYAALDGGQISILRKNSSLSRAGLFSPGHLAYAAYHGGTESWGNTSGSWSSAGGNLLLACSTLLRWYGAAPESKYPTSAGMSLTEDALTASSSHLIGYMCLPGPNASGADRENALAGIKTAVRDYGAVAVNFYYGSGSYDSVTHSCYAQNFAANHQALIVGWDDAKETKAATAGAFLVKNSYGSSSGDGGYIWLSYADKTITSPYVLEFENTVSGNHADRDIYYYDGLGYWVYMEKAGKKIETANVFTAARDERIDAVGFYVPAGGSYTASVRTGITGDPSTGTAAVTVEGNALYQGFYTVKLPAAVSVAEGKQFAVTLSIARNGSGYAYFEGASYSNAEKSVLTRTTTCGEGESYVRVGDSGYTDIMNFVFENDSGSRISGRQYGNACIKAYGNPSGGSSSESGGNSAESGGQENEDTSGSGAKAAVSDDALEADVTDDEAASSVTPKVTVTPTAVPKATATPTASPKPTATPSAAPKTTTTPSAATKTTTTPSAAPKTTTTPPTTPKAAKTPNAKPEATATPKATETPKKTGTEKSSDAKTTDVPKAAEDTAKQDASEAKKKAKTYPTVYGGVDYAAVYDFEYYMKKYPSLRKKYGSKPKAALRYFVKYGMKKMQRASKGFNVKSYINEYASLRRKYRRNWKKYYLHYIRTGSKAGWHGTGCTKMKNPLTKYRGKNYKSIYNFHYYIRRYASVRKKYRYDDYGALKYFVKYGRKKGQKAKK